MGIIHNLQHSQDFSPEGLRGLTAVASMGIEFKKRNKNNNIPERAREVKPSELWKALPRDCSNFVESAIPYKKLPCIQFA